jgi:lysosomal Pro-X carboxypeptidase
MLPAYPVRAACEFLANPALVNQQWPLLQAFNLAGGVFNNVTADVECYSLPTDIWEDGIWDYQWCTEQLPEETYFTRDGVNDMFDPAVITQVQVLTRFFTIHAIVGCSYRI